MNLKYSTFCLLLSISLFASSASIAKGFGHYALLGEILEAQSQILNKSYKGAAKTLWGLKPKPTEFQRLTKSLQKDNSLNLSWVSPLVLPTIPKCVEVVSIRCHITNEVVMSLKTDTWTSTMELFERLHQNNHPILTEINMGTLYSGLLVKHRNFRRSLLVLFPLIQKEKALAIPYELIQQLYNHSDRSDGKVAIKNL
ncbi:hypothetical protein [Pseudobacteriovorax antillogorgiicola]|uniref:Uncharacterized protein n=1 Tax=Pseudobacteriovorax antillogorgiicola TaxID=1513793 RepID=A0A1Y6BYR1_9BACT|nr:hypothetical protein [Pseudobacteriovorax antillogorgiicola]TCS50203.1 hypothetical protein EDD56_11321 [Pseudobacteriovorax antillogorgiicola]SMF32274.1 hypothetical protein SAMN06296036_11020 [Pseudobacteriovorax antillogorgiicola]